MKPSEKLLSMGTAAMTDYEIISAATGISVDVISDVFAAVADIRAQSAHAISAATGISLAKSTKIVALFATTRMKYSSEKKVTVLSSNDAAEILRPALLGNDREVFAVTFLKNNSSVIRTEVMFTGGATVCLVDTKKIIKRALDLGAVGIIVGHNHPSGSVQPSSMDDILTEKIVGAAKLFDIKMLDHVIIADNGSFYSYAGEGKL